MTGETAPLVKTVGPNPGGQPGAVLSDGIKVNGGFSLTQRVGQKTIVGNLLRRLGHGLSLSVEELSEVIRGRHEEKWVVVEVVVGKLRSVERG